MRIFTWIYSLLMSIVVFFAILSIKNDIALSVSVAVMMVIITWAVGELEDRENLTSKPIAYFVTIDFEGTHHNFISCITNLDIHLKNNENIEFLKKTMTNSELMERASSCFKERKMIFLQCSLVKFDEESSHYMSMLSKCGYADFVRLHFSQINIQQPYSTWRSED